MVDLCYPERMEFRYRAIGIVHSCFKEKFGIPRQAGLVPDARGILELFAPFNRREYLEGLEGFSHIWLQYVLHAASMASRRSKVRPPRLGGNQRLGVFGTRSNFRPNPIGLSLVTLEDIAYDGGGACLRLKGIDLLDQTPVLDIKPYIPYADCCPKAVGGFAGERPEAVLTVRFADSGAGQCCGRCIHRKSANRRGCLSRSCDLIHDRPIMVTGAKSRNSACVFWTGMSAGD
jgi:tRNA-Thr(GGU) m(6)t(6)A37 methyltransferase TsaA